MRIAAVGDIHVGHDTRGLLPHELEHLSDRADVLLIAGDLTQHGRAEEGKLVAETLARVRVPVVAVLGNHDYHQGQQEVIRRDLEQVGVHVLEGESVCVDIDGQRLGVAGVKGFGTGFTGACGSEFGEDEMKAFVRHSRERSEVLRQKLLELECDVKIALMHYSPIPETLAGERLEIYPFLGSHHLGEAIDLGKPQLALHGHAHHGTEHGVSRGGVPVRNVARPVIRLAYKVYCFADPSCPAEETLSVGPGAGAVYGD